MSWRGPLACPLAWSYGRQSTCIQAGSRRPGSANDLPLVSPPARLRPHSNDRGVLWHGAGIPECRGVAINCPVVRPLVRRPTSGFSPVPTTTVPAKEKKKQSRCSRPEGGRA
jgi:hypothetical protein